MNELQKRALGLGLTADATLQEVENRERELSKLQTRASFVPKSVNEENRTIDVVFATETPVRMFTWEDGVVDEILSMDPSHVDMQRLNGGAPVLDNHNRYDGTEGVLGVVENARIENGVGVATLRFSTREEVNGTWHDVKTGILRGISVGYSVSRYEITKEEGKRTQYLATSWTPFEISFAPVQADPNSQVRNKQTTIIDNNKTENKMNELELRALALGLPKTATLQEVERAEQEKVRKENEAVQAATLAERTRSTEITEAVRSAGLKPEFAEKLIKDGTSVDGSRKLIIDEIAKNNVELNGQNRNITTGADQADKVREAMTEALVHRVNPSETLTESGRAFRNMSLLDMAKFSLEQAGENTKNLSRREIAEYALQHRAHSTTDFPIILGATVNKSLRKAYELQARTFQPFTRKVNISDFKSVTRAQISNLVGNFDMIPEGGEYKNATLTEGKETYKLAKYGKIISINWESIINDDLNAFSRLPQAIASKAATKQSDIVYNILLDNSAMNDGVALFHATHGNLGSALAITSAGLSAARAAMRKQTDLNGDYINVSPKYLIVGPDKETEAQQLINALIVAAKTVDTNVFRGALEIIVDPRVTGNKWFLSADPNQIDTVEYAFLDGEGELFTDSRPSFTTDGIEIKARMVFAAKAIDHRGLYYNPGA